MLINVYATYDAAAKAYGKPLMLMADGIAIRAFKDAVNSTEQSDISNHPEQFTLCKIATYDDQTGKIEPQETIEVLAVGHEQVEHYEINEDIKVGGTEQ